MSYILNIVNFTVTNEGEPFKIVLLTQKKSDISYTVEKLCESSVKCQIFHRGKIEPPTPGSIVASAWKKKPVTELTFKLPLCEKMTVNVNIVGVMNDSHFLVCHTEPAQGI